MSITSALSSALSGLNATSRQAEVLSSNVANATTPGYARRTVSLSSHELGGTGQGVRVRGVVRDVDLFLLNDRRAAQADAADRGAKSVFLARLEVILGDPEDQASLTARINALDTSLIQATSHPESQAQLAAVVQAAGTLARGLNEASDAIQNERLQADHDIGASVDLLNTSLKQVEELNSQILAFSGTGRDVSSLLDQRAQIVDQIAEIVPLRELPRKGDQIALITNGGAVLLDGKAATIGFTPVSTIVPEMTLASGGLSGLTINDRPMPTTGPASLIQGGSLASLFVVRDELAVQGQARLDAMALDLYQRFADPAVDPTLAPDEAGLFTDNGNPYTALDPVGLSARLSLNAAVDPNQGGSVLRIRDGINAVGIGPTGNAANLLAMSEGLNAARIPSPGPLAPVARSLAGLASDILSLTSTSRLAAESETAFTTARYLTLSDLEAANGVDLDAEMQSLLVIEQTYAANAKVIQTVDEMINTLIGI